MNRYYENNHIPPPVYPQCPVHRSLEGQTALVTGASTGIGRGIALSLAKAGAAVCINYVKDQEIAREVVAEIKNIGTKAFMQKADVSSEDDVVEMFQGIEEQFTNLDIVVCNAGIQSDAPFDRMTIEQWDSVIAVNLRGQFLCTREAVRMFKRQGVRDDISCAAGKIISISSVHDKIPWAQHANYAASKAGIVQLIKSVAQESARYRIRANIISPGAVRTKINTAAWNTPEAYDNLMRLVPYKRIGEPDDIGRVAVWLASDESDYVNGATIYVDGGMTLYPGFETGG